MCRNGLEISLKQEYVLLPFVVHQAFLQYFSSRMEMREIVLCVLQRLAPSGEQGYSNRPLIQVHWLALSRHTSSPGDYAETSAHKLFFPSCSTTYLLPLGCSLGCASSAFYWVTLNCIRNWSSWNITYSSIIFPFIFLQSYLLTKSVPWYISLHSHANAVLAQWSGEALGRDCQNQLAQHCCLIFNHSCKLLTLVLWIATKLDPGSKANSVISCISVQGFHHHSPKQAGNISRVSWFVHIPHSICASLKRW